jgi:hypothetical protein
VKEVKPLEHGGNVKTITMKGVKHYTESGEYNGPTHKMPGNKVHTGKEHGEGSKPVSHKPGGPFKIREVHLFSLLGNTAGLRTRLNPLLVERKLQEAVNILKWFQTVRPK